MELPIAVGQVVAQKYRVDRFIGQGGMGVVVAGFHLELDQPVAIKFLLAESGLQSEGAERFRREARAAAKIHSEHVARVFDIGLLDERVPYMVMELLHGNELEIEMERRGALPVGEAVGYLLQAIDAVAEAHSAGIVHRDLKPTNLFLAQRADGSRIVKVLDFGISKSLGTGRQSEVALTRTAAFVGSPLYMSPEQMRSARDVDARADVWALGAILYAMVTGQLPHPGDSLPEVCLAVMNNPPRPLRDFVASVPEALEAIVQKCLSKEPAQRQASVAELAEQLLPFAPEWHLVVERATRLLGGAPVGSFPPSFVRSSHTPVVSSVTPQRISAPQMNDPTPPNATEAPWSKTGRKGAKRRRAPLLLAALFGLVAVLGVLIVMARRKPEAPALAAAPTPNSAPSTPLTPVISDVHAAVPAAPAAEVARTEAEASNVKQTPSATPSVASGKAGGRAAPRAVEPAPGAPRYTYFGGRR